MKSKSTAELIRFVRNGIGACACNESLGNGEVCQGVLGEEALCELALRMGWRPISELKDRERDVCMYIPKTEEVKP